MSENITLCFQGTPAGVPAPTSLTDLKTRHPASVTVCTTLFGGLLLAPMNPLAHECALGPGDECVLRRFGIANIDSILYSAKTVSVNRPRAACEVSGLTHMISEGPLKMSALRKQNLLVPDFHGRSSVTAIVSYNQRT